MAEGEHGANPLQRLIQQRLQERKLSYGDVARRGGLPRSTVYTLATTRNLVRRPRPATIDALAKGLAPQISTKIAGARRRVGENPINSSVYLAGRRAEPRRLMMLTKPLKQHGH